MVNGLESERPIGEFDRPLTFNQDRELIDERFARENGITPRELQILRLMSSGMKNQEIATQLEISGCTVRAHRRNIHIRLGVHNASAAVAALLGYK